MANDNETDGFNSPKELTAPQASVSLSANPDLDINKSGFNLGPEELVNGRLSSSSGSSDYRR